jgi:hypothetical protein
LQYDDDVQVVCCSTLVSLSKHIAPYIFDDNNVYDREPRMTNGLLKLKQYDDDVQVVCCSTLVFVFPAFCMIFLQRFSSFYVHLTKSSICILRLMFWWVSHAVLTPKWCHHILQNFHHMGRTQNWLRICCLLVLLGVSILRYL